MEKVASVLHDATDKLASAIKQSVDKKFPQIVEAQEVLLDLLISLNPSYNLES